MNKAFEVGKTCVICGKKFCGAGNNPAPIMDHGECCFECNCFKVIPARMIHAKEHRKGEENYGVCPEDLSDEDYDAAYVAYENSIHQ